MICPICHKNVIGEKQHFAEFKKCEKECKFRRKQFADLTSKQIKEKLKCDKIRYEFKQEYECNFDTQIKRCKICKQTHDKDGNPLRFYHGAKACVPCTIAYQIARRRKEREMVENHPLRHLSQEEIARRWNERNKTKVEEVKIKYGEKVK